MVRPGVLKAKPWTGRPRGDRPREPSGRISRRISPTPETLQRWADVLGEPLTSNVLPESLFAVWHRRGELNDQAFVIGQALCRLVQAHAALMAGPRPPSAGRLDPCHVGLSHLDDPQHFARVAAKMTAVSDVLRDLDRFDRYLAVTLDAARDIEPAADEKHLAIAGLEALARSMGKIEEAARDAANRWAA